MHSKTYTVTITTLAGHHPSTVAKSYRSISHMLVDLLPQWRDEVTAKTGVGFTRLYKTMSSLVEKVAKAIESEWKKSEEKK